MVVRKLQRKLFLFFSTFELMFPQDNRHFLLHQAGNRRRSTCREIFDKKKRRFVLPALKFYSLRFLKGAFCIDSAQSSNIYFAATTSSISSIKMSIKDSALVQKCWIEKFWVFSFVAESWYCELSRKPFKFNFTRYSNSSFPENFGLYLFHQGRNKNFVSYWDFFDERLAHLRSIH